MNKENNKNTIIPLYEVNPNIPAKIPEDIEPIVFLIN